MTDRFVIPAMIDSFLRAVSIGKTQIKYEIPIKTPRNHEFFHASDAFKCYRKRIFQRIGVTPEPPRPTSMRNFAIGDLVEGFIRQAIEWCCAWDPAFLNINATFGRKVEIPEWQTNGTMDLELQFPDESIDIWDIKSCKPGKIDNVKRGEKDEGYEGQITTYWKNHPDRAKIRNVGLCYIQKDHWNTHPEWVNPQEVMPKLQRDYGILLEYWKKYKDKQVVPPERPFQEERIRYPRRTKFETPGGTGKFPEWLCSPLYCSMIKNCKKIQGWWNEHPIKGDNQ